MSDLEKFLQQAAERMKERMREQQAGRPTPQRAAPVRQRERSAPRVEEPEILDAELIDPEPVRKPVRQRSEQLSSIGQRKAPVTDSVDQADERMSEHMHQVFDHSLGQLSQKKMAAVNDVSPVASIDLTNQSSVVDRREQINSPLIAVLQQPENLRAAFIVGEIFKRKF